MKKLIPFLMLVGATSGFSQGSVNFANLASGFTDTGIDRFVYADQAMTVKLTGTNMAAQLYYAAGNLVPEGSLIPLTAAPAKFYSATITSRFGNWSGGGRTFSSLDIGQMGTLQIRVWDGTVFGFDNAGGAAALAAGLAGKSAEFLFTPPTSSTDAIGLAMYNMRAFVGLVPEPSAIALSVLGIAGLLLIRRRK